MACGTIAGLALGLGGTAADEVANQNISKQSDSYASNALAQQRGFQQKASNVFNQSLNNSTPMAAQQQVQGGQQQLSGLINNIASTPLSLSSPTFGLTNTDAQGARQRNSNQLVANLGGYSNYPLQQQIGNLQANSNLGLISNQAQGAMSVLPYQLQQAQQSQQGLQALGSLLSTSGLLAGLGGRLSSGLTPINNYGTASLSTRLPAINDLGYGTSNFV